MLHVHDVEAHALKQDVEDGWGGGISPGMVFEDGWLKMAGDGRC